MASGTIYDHPLYYDVLFGWDRSVECDFYDRCFERHGVARGERVLELACGTGHVARRLARRGWRVTGLDLRPAMLRFLEQRAAAEGLAVDTLCADMTAFDARGRFGAAFNPMSSFRLLAGDREAEDHLRCVAAALRPGGVYVLDLELAARADARAGTTDEPWEMSRGGVTVSACDDGVRVVDGGASRALAWGEETHLRVYTRSLFRARVERAGGFGIEAWYPEAGRATGVSAFCREPAPRAPRSGRTMVVLRRSR